MFFFSWLGRKLGAGSRTSMDADLGVAEGDGSSGYDEKKKSARHQRRELLYAVVRESMNRAGILAATFKFKVLSLDPQGTRYMVMMDLSAWPEAGAAALMTMEADIIQAAQARHALQVTAVYWRGRQLAANKTPVPTPPQPKMEPVMADITPPAGESPDVSVSVATPLIASPPAYPRRPMPDFEDTIIISPKDRS